MPTILTNGIQLPDKGSVDWYSSMQSNYNLIDTHLGDTDIHVTTEDKANWDGKANASHTHTSSELTDIGDFATKQYVDNSISGLVDNAPDALNTLNELSAALNDDSNFASTVTTALGAKANSADLATVATSGSYTDLTDKPTINDSTITIQKNGSTVDTFTTNGSAKTIDIPVPTKTSDLTNDSNFVDTSNSAVSSGITSAKVTDYDTHIADTDIHVTTVDKTTWNTVTSKANDSDVVHKSGNETISGVKTFSDNTLVGNGNTNITISSNRQITANGLASTIGNHSYCYMQLQAKVNYADSSSPINVTVGLDINEDAYADGKRSSLSPTSNNLTNLGKSGKRWANVYATNYYYGGSEIEFSQKFVTTDTAQTISGNKTFSSINGVEPSSLSLPSDTSIDISAYVTNLSGGSNQYVAPANGIVSVDISSTNRYVLYNNNLGIGDRLSGSNFRRATIIPVRKNDTVIIQSDGGTLNYARFYPCQGNV